jgi:hypothetical protein
MSSSASSRIACISRYNASGTHAATLVCSRREMTAPRHQTTTVFRVAVLRNNRICQIWQRTCWRSTGQIVSRTVRRRCAWASSPWDRTRRGQRGGATRRQRLATTPWTEQEKCELVGSKGTSMIDSNTLLRRNKNKTHLLVGEFQPYFFACSISFPAHPS